MNDLCQIETEISFFRQGSSERLSQTFCKRLADTCQNTEFFLEEKLTRRERRAIETLINNHVTKERAFYHLNERFASNKSGEIIFSTRTFETLHVKHFTNDLPTRA